MSVYGKISFGMGSGCGGWLAQVLADQGHLLPGEGAVPALVAGSGEGFDQGVTTGYPACEVAHGGGGSGIGKILQGEFLFVHGS